MKKTYLFLFLAGLSAFIPLKTQAFFADVDVTHPYYFSIRELYDNRIVEGYNNEDKEYYRPLNAVSRVAALKILLLASETPIEDLSTTQFPDINTSEWYSPYVATASNKDIVSGFRDGRFYPAAEVSRAQMLKMSFLAFGAPISKESEQDNWYDVYMDFAETFHIIDEEAKPHTQLSRGEVAEIIYRTKKVAEKQYEKPYQYSGFGLASYYAGKFHGRSTASGETYNKDDLTAAHRTLPFGTRLKITYQDKSVIVRINDRGPYHSSRIIDLSEAAFKKLSHTGAGVLSIAFELYSDAKEGNQPVPEYIREELQPQTLNIPVPDVVEDYISNETERRKPPRGSYIDGSIPHLPKDFFPNATLYKPFPQKVYEGDILFLSGRTSISSPKSVTVFLKPIKAVGAEYRNINGSLSGSVFQIPVNFLQAGTYSMGIVVGNEKQSRVEVITVLPRPENEYYGTGKPLSINKAKALVDPVTSEVIIPIAQNGDSTDIYKIRLHQPEKTYDVRVEAGISEARIAQDLFFLFHQSDPVFIDIYKAPSSDGTLANQSGSWKQTHKGQYSMKALFKDKETDDLTIFRYPQYTRDRGDIVIRGKRNTEKRLSEYAYVTQKGESVQKISIDFDGDTNFSLPVSLDKHGTYVVEFISDQGEILFNKGLYVYPEEVLPILPWQEDLSIKASTSSMRYWINSIRSQYKRQGVTVDDRLTSFAQGYAEEMASKKFISHTDPAGNSFEDRIKDFGLKGEYGENLSYGSTIDLAVTGLENSGSHLSNMIAPYWKSVGIGYARTPIGEYYISHVFGR